MKTIEDAVRKYNGEWPSGNPLSDVLVWAGSLGWNARTKEWAGKEFHDWHEVGTRTEFDDCTRRLRNEPSWDDAPDWAVAKAQDSDGSWWWWYSTQPKAYNDSWEDDKEEGEAQLAGKGEVIGDWRDTLRLRPEENKVEDKADWYKRGDLPPVGTVCRLRFATTADVVVTITYVGDGVLCYRNEKGMEYTAASDHVELRPIQTKREQLIEKACKVVSVSGSIKETVTQLANAGMLKMPEDKP